MSTRHTNTSRRNFVLRGGAAFGVGITSSAGAATLAASDSSQQTTLTQLQQQVAHQQECAALRELHQKFTALMERREYASAAELFDERAELDLSGVKAVGQHAIRTLLVRQYSAQEVDVLHTAYRPNVHAQQDVVTLSADRQHAVATYHMDVQVSTPLQSDCTAAQMARLQGNLADCRWESGRLEAQYLKSKGQWHIAALRYVTA